MRLYNTDKLRALHNAVVTAQQAYTAQHAKPAFLRDHNDDTKVSDDYNAANQAWDEYLIKGEPQDIQAIDQGRALFHPNDPMLRDRGDA